MSLRQILHVRVRKQLIIVLDNSALKVFHQSIDISEEVEYSVKSTQTLWL